jgi:hypothetical protein
MLLPNLHMLAICKLDKGINQAMRKANFLEKNE